MVAAALKLSGVPRAVVVIVQGVTHGPGPAGSRYKLHPLVSDCSGSCGVLGTRPALPSGGLGFVLFCFKQNSTMIGKASLCPKHELLPNGLELFFRKQASRRGGNPRAAGARLPQAGGLLLWKVIQGTLRGLWLVLPPP